MVKRWYPPICRVGITIITSTIIPIPPIQWVILRQNKIDFGKDSISVSIDEPVVVNPDMDSKNALVNEGIAPEKMYGKQPIRLINNHDNVTVRYASFLVIAILLLLFSVNIYKTIPTTQAMIEENKKGKYLSE
jgi:hypothetical protein